MYLLFEAGILFGRLIKKTDSEKEPTTEVNE